MSSTGANALEDQLPQCKRCGSSATFVDCEHCEDGYVQDDLGDDVVPELVDVPCPDCRGNGGWWRFLSSLEWCEAHPLKGRENVARGEIE